MSDEAPIPALSSEPSPRKRLGAVINLRASIGSAPLSNRQRPGVAPDGRSPAMLIEAVQSLSAAGVTDVRIPFDWARLEPRQATRDRDAEEAYGLLLDACGSMTVWASMFEGEVPQWFDDMGAFADERAAARRWPHFVEYVAETFGDRIGGWVLLDRPVQFARAAYLDGSWPPGRRDGETHANVMINLIAAHRDGARIVSGNGPVVVALDLERIVVPRDDVPAAQRARARDTLAWRVWELALRDGTVSVPGLADRQLDDLAWSADIVCGWLPAPGPDAEWSGELLRRMAEVMPTQVEPIVRLGGDDPIGHLEHQWSILDDATRDGIAMTVRWLSPAIGGHGALVDEGGAASAVLDRAVLANL
ncbi:MAG: family 1 glycosylhydrolase [Acidimicrobiia bacterium]